MKSVSRFDPLSELDTDSIRNVFVYVCDALRWDFRPKRVSRRGVTLRTTAHGSYTPSAISSLATGCYPPRHGATRFETPIRDEQDTLFDISGTTASFRHNQWDGHPVFDLLGQSVGTSLADLEPPFVYVEHDHGSHAPYPDLDLTVDKTFSHLSRDPDQLRKHYRNGIKDSVDRFFQAVETLEERGLRDETIIVFTSDHGELLGEHGGFVGHSLPITPELVYVPMVFIHPSLPMEEFDDEVVEQADLLPTIHDILDTLPESTSYDGQSLVQKVPRDRISFTQGTIYFPGDTQIARFLDPIYQAYGIWTNGGGHVFVETNPAKRVLTGVYDATRSAETGSYNSSSSLLSSLRRIVPMYLSGHHTFGAPRIGKTDAQDRYKKIIDSSFRPESPDATLTEETIERLENLGYR